MNSGITPKPAFSYDGERAYYRLLATEPNPTAEAPQVVESTVPEGLSGILSVSQRAELTAVESFTRRIVRIGHFLLRKTS